VNAPNDNLRVKFWDLGPERPIAPDAPVKPEHPKGTSAADIAVAEVEYEDAIEQYKQDLRAYSARKKEHDHWRTTIGGPVQIESWSVDMQDAFARDPRRYAKELPKGYKPGKQHYENRGQISCAHVRPFRSVVERGPGSRGFLRSFNSCATFAS
jgi:hypothetical protein